MSTEGLTRRKKTAADKRERMNARILVAAQTLFDQHGYHGATRRDVGQAVGISLVALNGYFPTKEGLVIAAYAPYVQTVVDTVEVSEGASDAKVRDFVTGFSAVLHDHPAMAVALLPQPRDPRNAGRDEERMVTIRQLAEFLGRLLDSCGVLSELEMGLSNERVAEHGLLGLVAWTVQYPEGSYEDAAELTLDGLLANLYL